MPKQPFAKVKAKQKASLMAEAQLILPDRRHVAHWAASHDRTLSETFFVRRLATPPASGYLLLRFPAVTSFQSFFNSLVVLRLI
jgi:hypothetical protein